MDTTKF